MVEWFLLQVFWWIIAILLAHWGFAMVAKCHKLGCVVLIETKTHTVRVDLFLEFVFLTTNQQIIMDENVG